MFQQCLRDARDVFIDAITRGRIVHDVLAWLSDEAELEGLLDVAITINTHRLPMETLVPGITKARGARAGTSVR